MREQKLLDFINKVLANTPKDWLDLTTHRLDVYNEEQAKTEFLQGFESLFKSSKVSTDALSALPTAYDYIRLGHPLSSVLEWTIAGLHQIRATNVISFSSESMPILAVLRKNLMEQKNTLIAYKGALPKYFDPEIVQKVYGYSFELYRANNPSDIPAFEGSTIFLSEEGDLLNIELSAGIDFYVSRQRSLGSIIIANENQDSYISEIQHVRRRESIAMTPVHCYNVLKHLTGESVLESESHVSQNKHHVIKSIQQITGAGTSALIGSSGLSIQYAIVMGLIHEALVTYPGHPVKVIVPPNCYGGTNDQARRVAACLDRVAIVDLPVDREHDMAQSVDIVLDQLAHENCVPIIIVEIPTNPRVEVPDLDHLKHALSKPRNTANGTSAIPPVFILDQTFCPNVHFLGESDILADVQTISYVSGSKFPSGGRCTAGYCQTNKKAEWFLSKIELHLKLCDNGATDPQLEVLAQQLPSMNQRILDAYSNTRTFVDFIERELPEAKINFVSNELAQQGFTPSVFSLDLPTKGSSAAERESFKREANHHLIKMMINRIPEESKYCVSYGQLKGCYWTIPATSTQGTTKEEDKDYIARVSCSPNMNLDQHKAVFAEFVKDLKKKLEPVHN